MANPNSASEKPPHDSWADGYEVYGFLADGTNVNFSGVALRVAVGADSAYHVLDDNGADITDPSFPRPSGGPYIWRMANGVTPDNAIRPDLINMADA